MGSAFHAGVQAWEQSGRAMKAYAAQDLAVEEYDSLIASEWERIDNDPSLFLTGGRTLPAADIARRRDKVAEYVRDYVDYALDNEHKFRPAELPTGEPAVEVAFSITLGGVIVRGAIDQMVRWVDTGALTVRDFKAGSKLPATPLQLSVYGIAWRRCFGDPIQWGDFYMCKNGNPTGMFNLLDYPEGVVSAWVEMMDRSERSGVYLPNGSDACRVCTVRPSCSLMGGVNKSVFYLDAMIGNIDSTIGVSE